MTQRPPARPVTQRRNHTPASPSTAPPASNKRVQGNEAEVAAAAWYELAGYTVLDSNWYTRGGELDLVLERDGTVVFCEVKMRTSDAFGSPLEAVTEQKARRIHGLAVQWLDAHAHRFGEMRFDVAAVRPSDFGYSVEITEAAF